MMTYDSVEAAIRTFWMFGWLPDAVAIAALVALAAFIFNLLYRLLGVARWSGKADERLDSSASNLARQREEDRENAEKQRREDRENAERQHRENRDLFTNHAKLMEKQRREDKEFYTNQLERIEKRNLEAEARSREELDKVRADIGKLTDEVSNLKIESARLTERVDGHFARKEVAIFNSPKQLSELGKEVSETASAAEWARENADALADEAAGKEDFEIEDLSIVHVERNFGDSPEFYKTVRKTAYHHSLNPEMVLEVFQIELRNALLSKNDDDVENDGLADDGSGDGDT